ncbi:MAG: alpha/beta hydrolase [Nitrospiraceae bacterium]|nr:alpha/beta hydrolase [Nitrospiraceae bacterium]
MLRRDLLVWAIASSATPFHAEAQQTEKSAVQFVNNKGISLAAQSFGSSADPALVLLMGATASMLGWPDELCDALAGHGLFVIRFDHRDTGLSTTVPLGEARYAVEDMAEDVLAVMDGHGLRNAHLMGMSLGGYIAQMLAVTQPERVPSLTLIGSEPLGWDGEPLPHISGAFLDHFATFGDLDWSDQDAVMDFLLEIERLCAGSGQPFDEKRAAARIREILERTDNVASMFNHSSRTTRSDWTGRFREISCPTLVLHGAEDPILPVENGRAIAEGIAGAELVIMDGVGHELPMSHVTMIADRVARHVFATMT